MVDNSIPCLTFQSSVVVLVDVFVVVVVVVGGCSIKWDKSPAAAADDGSTHVLNSLRLVQRFLICRHVQFHI